MSRILDTGYTFNPSARAIDFSGVAGFQVRRLIAVVNLTRRAIIYALDKPSLGFTGATPTVVTLLYDTTQHSASDVLSVVYGDSGDAATGTGQAHALEQLVNLLGASEAQAPATRLFEITASATADLATATRAIRCEIGGTLLVDTVGGSLNTPMRFKDGETRPVQVRRVRSLGTASGVEGMA